MKVASHVGAWIETPTMILYQPSADVASHVGAWIETYCYCGPRL